MPAPKNVLLIVVDQWRGLMLPKLGADYLKVPNIDRLSEEGVTFRNHFTQTAPCGPARASLLTGLYQMNHRAVQNTIPLDARFTNLKNVLLIVVDQWRGLMLPKLGADYLKVPNIDRLSEEGVTFRNHFTQTAPCGPARASLLTGLYQMNHRAVQNTIPLDARFTNL